LEKVCEIIKDNIINVNPLSFEFGGFFYIEMWDIITQIAL